jgi:hypothetical protein
VRESERGREAGWLEESVRRYEQGVGRDAIDCSSERGENAVEEREKEDRVAEGGEKEGSEVDPELSS